MIDGLVSAYEIGGVCESSQVQPRLLAMAFSLLRGNVSASNNHSIEPQVKPYTILHSMMRAEYPYVPIRVSMSASMEVQITPFDAFITAPTSIRDGTRAQ